MAMLVAGFIPLKQLSTAASNQANYFFTIV